MQRVYLMAVDLGTTYIKAAVYDTEGNQISSARTAVVSDSSRPGVFLQSGTEIYNSVLAAMKSAVQMAGSAGRDIAAIGFTGQMAGFMGVDRDWNDITSWSCSLDTRYVPYANEQMRTMKQQFLDICGTNAPLMSAKCKWFVSDFPEEASKVAKYMLISSYVIGRLGKVDIDKASLGSSYITWTGLADVRKRDWSAELCEASGVIQDLLPDIVDYHTVSGYLSDEAASELGIPSGIPLIAGAGDKIAGCIGAGILSTGDTIFEASSYGAVSVLAKGYTPNPDRYDYDAIPAAENGKYYLHKYLPGSGITLQWFLDTFGGSDGQTADAFASMEDAVSRIPCGSDGLMAVGLLGGSAMPFDGEIRGTWTGHTWSHTKAHFYRSLLDMWDWELIAYMRSNGFNVFSPYNIELGKIIFRAIATKEHLKGAKFLMFQDNPGEGMQAYIFKRFYWWEKECSEQIEKFFGAKLIYKSWKAVNQRASEIDAQTALDEFASWDVPCVDITEENKLNVARLYLAIREVIDELGGVDGIGANCLNESMYSNTTPCLIWNMLFEKYGIIWCCEGDTLTLISTYVLYQSLRQPIMMTNIYPFLVGKAAIHHEKIDDFPPVPDPENYALGVHCGYAGFAPRCFCTKWKMVPKVLAIVDEKAYMIDCEVIE